MMKTTSLPETGYLRLPQIIGQRAVSEEEAKANKDRAEEIRKTHPVTSSDPTIRERQEKKLAKLLAKVGPRTPQPAIIPIIPVSKSSFWNMVKEGRIASGVKLSQRCTAWRVEDIRALIEKIGG